MACIIQTTEPGEEPTFHNALDDFECHTAPNLELFQDALEDLIPGNLHFFDPSNAMSIPDLVADHDFHLSIHFVQVLDSSSVNCFLSEINFAELRGDHKEFNSFAYVSRAAIQDHAERYMEYLGYHPVNIIRKTLENTSQLRTTILQFPM